MKRRPFGWSAIILGGAIILAASSCAKNEASPQASSPGGPAKGEVVTTAGLDIDFSKHLVTFIELGADKCVPCKAMQPIMKEVAAAFPDKVQVVFYDVWKNPEPARYYSIQLIPTQVFVGPDGKEFFRHVGFFAKEEILKILKDKGVS